MAAISGLRPFFVLIGISIKSYCASLLNPFDSATSCYQSTYLFTMDGIEGIYIPGALSRDVGKQSSDRAIQSVNIPIIDPSIGAQAASAGIEAAKTFLGRKAKLTQVSVKAGYRVLLKDANAKSI